MGNKNGCIIHAWMSPVTGVWLLYCAMWKIIIRWNKARRYRIAINSWTCFACTSLATSATRNRKRFARNLRNPTRKARRANESSFSANATPNEERNSMKSRFLPKSESSNSLRMRRAVTQSLSKNRLPQPPLQRSLDHTESNPTRTQKIYSSMQQYLCLYPLVTPFP